MEPLIELVSAFPVLYDPKHTDYLRMSLKERIWEHISRKLDLPSGEVAKAHWRKLRDSHRVALRRQMKKKSDHRDARIRPWLYQKNMEFLLPYMPNYRSSSMADYDSQTEDNAFETVNVSHTFDDYASIENELNSHVPKKTGKHSDDDDFDYAGFEDELKGHSPKKQSSKASSKTVRVVEDESIIMKTLKNLEERAVARDSLRRTIESMSTAHKHSENDPLYSFFISMYNTTKNLPVRQQLEVRREVFNLITKIEESVLEGGGGSSSSSGQQTVGAEYASNSMVSSLTTML
ncbi:hypothetical protein LSTR_LSTR009290 [Laodelphax striatellus]|uniref:MADF domain-containing protein n=1 Tax=Laodelphax striatellus TaxID=195883 RepID=A0A482XMG0_LAOST|nr:hypothetical protein LSTR_LSTR009290 [Laodelphax striatellus]